MADRTPDLTADAPANRGVRVEACPTGAVLAAVERALDALAGVTRSGVAPAERVALVRRARVLAGRMDALAAVLLAEADAAGATLTASGTPTTSWLALSGSSTGREAAGELFAANDVQRHAIVADAALSGRLGVRQARAVARGVDALPATLSEDQREQAQHLLVERAAREPANRVPSLVKGVLAEVAPEAAPTPEADQSRLEAQARRARARRSLAFHPDGDGAVTFRGSLPDADAAGFVRMIEALVESDRRAGRERATDRRDPLAERRTPDQRRADALLGLVRLAENAGSVPRVAGDRPRVVVTMREADLRARAEQAGLLATGQQVSAGDLRRLCCDADLMPVVLGTESEVLDVGRTERLVTPAIRRALSVRDGGCAFPNCSAPDSRCDAHHLTPWWAGGATSLANLVLLCPFHHGLVEPPRFWSGHSPDRWEVRLDAAGAPEFLPPRRQDRQRTPLPANRPPPGLVA